MMAVTTDSLMLVVSRALTHLNAGNHVHLTGPPGSGKTTLAAHIAEAHGRHWVKVRRDVGARKAVAQAHKLGHTILWDEFDYGQRKQLDTLLTAVDDPDRHPGFRVLLVSARTPYRADLRSRMVTIPLDYPDRDTEARIARCEVDTVPIECVTAVVDVIQELRRATTLHQPPPQPIGVRATLAVVKALRFMKTDPDVDDVYDVFRDALRSTDLNLDEVKLSAALRRHFKARAA